MAVRIFAEIAQAYPGITPRVLWTEYTRAQTMILWREAREKENRMLGQTTMLQHAAISASLSNAFGKTVPEFEQMIEELMGVEPEEGEGAAVPLEPAPDTGTVDDETWQEFE